MSLIERVHQKVTSGVALSEQDALELYQSPNLVEIGRLANAVNHDKNGGQVFYNINRHINPTNICALSCKFCAYSRKPGQDGAYAYTIDEMVTKAREAVDQGATEIHIVGGLHPQWRFANYKEMIANLKRQFPQLHLKAFTAVELDWMARRERRTISEILEDLVDAGLGSLPGGGAEIFHPEVRNQICDTKVSAEQWIETHRIAHRLGLHSNCTMLYGHIETFAHRVDHMRRLRELQSDTRGFNAFIPLSFQPHQNEMGIDRYTFGFDDLKTIAIARLYLHNFQHIKAYWIMLGQDIAQLALDFGANDLDGTVIEEKISRMAGGRSGVFMNQARLTSIIAKTGRMAVERDTLYRPLPKSEQVGGGGIAPLCEFDHYGEGQEHRATFAMVAIPRWQHPIKISDIIDSIRGGPAVQQVILDLTLAGEPTPDFGMLIELTWALKHSAISDEVCIRGLKSLWNLAQTQSVEVEDLIERLRDAGVDAIGSAPSETETDLTHSEITGLHKQIHALGIPTYAKVEIAAPRSDDLSNLTPQWPAFLNRLQALVRLHDATHLIQSVSVEVAPNSFVAPNEYLQAISQSRRHGHNIPSIIAPIMQIPSLSPTRGQGSSEHQYSVEKFAPLALHFGADSLGAIPVDSMHEQIVRDLIRSVGFISDESMGAPGARAREQQPQHALRHAPRHVPILGAPPTAGQTPLSATSASPLGEQLSTRYNGGTA